MTQRYYFNTSVFGGAFDTEFKAETLQLFEKVKMGQLICVYSDLTEAELEGAPARVKAFFYQPEASQLERVKLSPDG